MNEITYRIYGDNIVECERMLNIIQQGFNEQNLKKEIISNACLRASFISSSNVKYIFDCIPGFGRWSSNIMDIFYNNGGILSETPDIIITKLTNSEEKVLLALEFCSALQAGNQSWQRSGRGYSTSLAKIPYLYIIDFVKYELDNNRVRKALRFPNAIVPFSFLSQTNKTNIMNLAVFIKAEEFQPTFSTQLQDFDESILSNDILPIYIKKVLTEEDYSNEETILIQNLNQMLLFIANKNTSPTSLSKQDWESIICQNYNLIEYTKNNVSFKCKKKIAQKSIHSEEMLKFINLVKTYSKGISSGDLPFALISSDIKKTFLKEVFEIYNIDYDSSINDYTDNKDLIICMMKGFKPGGDDDRPDRGLLPLLRMISLDDTEIMTFLYGPLLRYYIDILQTNYTKLGERNGLWKSILSLSNFVLLDSNIAGTDENYFEYIPIKSTINYITCNNLYQPCSLIPSRFGEHDVDFIIYYIFKYLVPNSKICMCNPPGGDWSGISIFDDNKNMEYRWLSLPRESMQTEKRPDHVIELSNITNELWIISIESKENFNNLENNIGNRLNDYLKYFFDFMPSVERNLDGQNWNISNSSIDASNFNFVSVGVALGYPNNEEKYNCDLIICLNYTNDFWKIKLDSFSKNGNILKQLIIDSLDENKNIQVEN